LHWALSRSVLIELDAQRPQGSARRRRRSAKLNKTSNQLHTKFMVEAKKCQYQGALCPGLAGFILASVGLGLPIDADSLP
jgi:hypothetical protein